jgi:hypothetical protein
MTVDEALHKLDNLRRHCKRKNIPFNLTLKDWVDAWGDRIDRRGELQLQRVQKDKGFVVGNLMVGERP